MRKVRFDLSGIKGCNVSSFIIRECNGDDEVMAKRMAKANNKDCDYEDIIREVARLSVVAVDDKEVVQPYMDVNKWNLKTRSYLLRAFTNVNAIEDEEDDFLETATDQ